MANDVLFTPGETLAGKYRVECVIGSGGMGVVVAATHLELDQLVAMKFLLPRAAANPTFAERFTREARLAAKLRGEHVVRVMDVGTLGDGAPYMVMEYMEGDDLDRVLRTHGPLPFPVAIDYMVQACEGIAEAHDHGIVHRDLKPRNLFLSARPNGAPLVKVLDFGISKLTTPDGELSLTKTSDVMGSPNYMSPEQIRSARDVDPRSDIWSLGVVLYELLTGHVPFVAETITQLCSMILEQRPAPLTILRPDVPPALVAAVERCLAKDRAQRFPDVRALIAELSPFSATLAMGTTVRLSTSDVSPKARTVASSSERLLRGNGGKGGRTSVTWGETLGEPSGPAAPPNRTGVVLGVALVVAVLAGAGSVVLYRKSFARPKVPPTPPSSSVVFVEPVPAPPPPPPPDPAPPPPQTATAAAAPIPPTTRHGLPTPHPPPPPAPPPQAAPPPPPPPPPPPSPSPAPSASGYTGPSSRK